MMPGATQSSRDRPPGPGGRASSRTGPPPRVTLVDSSGQEQCDHRPCRGTTAFHFNGHGVAADGSAARSTEGEV